MATQNSAQQSFRSTNADFFFFYVIYSKHKTHSPYAFFFRCFQTCRQFDKVVGFKLKSRLSIFSCGYLKSDVYFLWPNLIARWGRIPTFYQYGARHYGICYVKLYVTPVVEWTLFTLNPHKEVKELVKTYSSIQPWKQSRSYLCCWRCYTEFSIDHMVLISLRLHRWTDKSSSAATFTMLSVSYYRNAPKRSTDNSMYQHSVRHWFKRSF